MVSSPPDHFLGPYLVLTFFNGWKQHRSGEGGESRPRWLRRAAVGAKRFMSYVDNAKLADKTKSYLRNGWRLLEQTNIAGMRLNHITAEDVDALPLPGGPYNINCALKTLRRMLHKAEEWGLIAKVPKLKLIKELGRTLRLDQEAERKLWLPPTACWKEAHGY